MARGIGRFHSEGREEDCGAGGWKKVDGTPAAEKEGEDAIEEDPRTFIFGLKGSSIVDYSEASNGVKLPLQWSDGYIAPKIFSIYFQQMCIWFRVQFDKSAVQLDLDPSIFDPIEEGDEPAESGLIQIGTYDFDADGIDELVIGFRVGMSDPLVWVFRYFPPQREADSSRVENWKKFGPFQGQFIVNLEGPSIVMPYGASRLYWEYTWVKDRFIQTAD